MIVTPLEFAAFWSLVILAFAAGYTLGSGRRTRAEDQAYDAGYEDGRTEGSCFGGTPVEDALEERRRGRPVLMIRGEAPTEVLEPLPPEQETSPVTFEEEIRAMVANAEVMYARLLERDG